MPEHVPDRRMRLVGALVVLVRVAVMIVSMVVPQVVPLPVQRMLDLVVAGVHLPREGRRKEGRQQDQHEQAGGATHARESNPGNGGRI